MNEEEYLKIINELIEQYKLDKSAMPLSGIASVGYHLKVNLKFLIALIQLTDFYIKNKETK